MKLVKMLSLGADKDKMTSQEILTIVVKAMQQGGDFEEIGKRLRLLKALKAATGTNLVVEDADHAKLVECVRGFRFSVASEELAEILAEVVNAKDAPAVAQAAE